MKLSFFLCGVLLNLVFAGAMQVARAAAPAPGAFSTSINVKDYGARGDGIADDTRAIQKAANAAMSQYENWPVRARHWNHLKNGISDNPHSEIVFPAGTYNISGPIVFRRYASLRGIGQAVIRQTDPAKDSFYFHGLLRSTVENLHFEGGKTQLRFWTANNGTARVAVQRCVFSNSAGYAIECRSYSKKPRPGEKWNASLRWSPYELEWVDGWPQLTENSPENLQIYNNSTFADIAFCRFENVMGAADLSGDTSALRDCEITVSPQLEGAVFHLAGLMHLRRVRGLAKPAPDKHQYWIETEGGYREISVRDCDFDTAVERGLCLVRSAAALLNSSLIVQDSRIKSAGSPEGALIWLAADTQPSMIVVRGVRETSGRPVKAIAWEKTPDSAAIKNTNGSYKYAVTLTANSPNLDDNIPEVLAPLRLKPIPDSALKETFVPELSWDYHDLEAQALATGQVLRAADYGVDQNPETDDTAAVQNAFAAAAKQPGSLLVFPAGVLTLSDTIQLPPQVVVRAAGVTTFLLENSAKDLFSAPDARAIAFKNCDFNGGRNGLNLHSEAMTKARLAFDNCAFYDQQENGILALAGKGEIGEDNQTELHLRGGIFATMRALTTNAAHSQLGTFWAINDPRLNDDAFFRNLGGAMRVQAMLGNPTLWQGERSKPPADLKDWQLSRNTRWFDNWGQLYSVDNRFGGESGGMCNVFNRSANGTVYIEGGITRFMNGVTRQAILSLEKEPRRAVLRDISGMERGGVLIVQNADGSDGRNNPNLILRGMPAS